MAFQETHAVASYRDVHSGFGEGCIQGSGLQRGRSPARVQAVN